MVIGVCKGGISIPMKEVVIISFIRGIPISYPQSFHTCYVPEYLLYCTVVLKTWVSGVSS